MLRKFVFFIYLLSTAYCLLSAHYCFSQNSKVDSLSLLLKKDIPDSNKVNHLNAIGWELMYTNPDTAIYLSNEALKIAINIKNEKCEANSYSNLGVYSWVKGEFPVSLSYQFKALKLREKIKDKRGEATSLSNIGIVYWNQSENDKALEYLKKALAIMESLGNKEGVAKNIGNIGVLYYQKGDFEKADEYYMKALKLDEELGAKNRIATDLGNIGVVYHALADSTLKNAMLRNNLYAKALEYYRRALEMEESLGNSVSIIRHMGNIGTLNIQLGEYKNAEIYLVKALNLSDSLGFMNEQMQFENSLSAMYEQIGEYSNSLFHYRLYTNLKDSLFNEEKNKELTKHEMNYEFEKKENALKAEQDKKDALAKAEKQKQELLIWLVVFIAIAIAMIALVIFRSLKITKKQKELIQNQKIIVEVHQKEIIDSITYARRIQRSLLPTEKYIDKNIKRLNTKS